MANVIGYSFPKDTTIGTDNTAVGDKALDSNISGTNTSAFGYNALTANTSGTKNTAVGANALGANTTGGSNTAIGNAALDANTTANNNVAVGDSALGANTTGASNTAVGASALVANSTGGQNTALGLGALANSTNNNNIAIGYNSGTDAVQNITTANNTIVMGNDSHTVSYIKIAWTATSDARDKMNFAAVPHGLNFVLGLKPIAYQFKKSRNLDEPSGQIRYGFKAQDVLPLEGATPVIINADDPVNLKYNESCLIPVLVKAIQELKSEFDAYRAAHP